jgi:hypothetical protein
MHRTYQTTRLPFGGALLVLFVLDKFDRAELPAPLESEFRTSGGSKPFDGCDSHTRW